MKKIGIYQIKNLVNQKVYIGQSVNIDRRFQVHTRKLNKQRHENRYLQRAWLKYGEANFEFSIVELCDKSDLNARETHWIAETKAEYNIVREGTNPPNLKGRKWSATHCANISKALTGIVRTAEHNKKLGLANKGKTRSQAQKDIISRKLKGRILTPEHRENIRQAVLKRHMKTT